MLNRDDSMDGLLIASFQVNQAAFGIDARMVQEVVKVGEITVIHDAPESVAGVRNLRGRIVTVIDLAQHLGLGQVTASDDNRLLIIENDGESYGFLVDAVTEAMALEESEISEPPVSLDPDLAERLRGVWRGSDRLMSILDPQTLFHWTEVS